MDEDFWIRFYKDWTIPQLENEVGTCFIFQHNLLQQVSINPAKFDHNLKLLHQSQQRVLVIFQAIRQLEKVKNG